MIKSDTSFQDVVQAESNGVGDDYQYQDEVLSLIGDGKRWQVMVTVLLSLCGMCPDFNNTLAVDTFYSPLVVDAYCHQYPKYANWSKEKWMQLSHYNGTNPCRIYDLDYDSLPSNYTPSITTPTKACNRTVFFGNNGYTLTEKWNMICHRDHLISMYQYLYYFGKILGNLLFGIWSDRRGRKDFLILCVLGQPVCGLIVISSLSYNIFILGLTMLGIFVGGAFTLSLVYVVEMLGPKTCTVYTTLAFLSICVSSFCLSLIQASMHRWHHTQLFISVPIVMFLIWKEKFEESPRWLLVMLRTEDAVHAMKAIAHSNKTSLPSTLKFVPAPKNGVVGEEDDDRHCNIWNIRNYPNLRVLMILLMLLHNGVSMILQVRTLRFRKFHLTLSVQAAMMGCVELCGVGCALYLVPKIGHTKVTSISMMFYGFLNLFLLIFVHGMEEEDHVMYIVLAIITYFLVIISYVATCVYSSRVLPTIIRGSGFGLATACSNIGMLFVTYTSRSTKMADVKVFIVFFSMLALIMALVAYVLPEAVERELPDTLRDGEHFQSDLKKPTAKPAKLLSKRKWTYAEKNPEDLYLHIHQPAEAYIRIRIDLPIACYLPKKILFPYINLLTIAASIVRTNYVAMMDRYSY